MIRLLLFVLLFTLPAMADNFSNNQSGVSSCTVDIVGSSSTPITATANYSPITYNCAAGTYLPADATECATCLAGYYCPSGDYAFNELNASGLNACPGARPSSNPGNSSQNNCYTPCASDKIDAGLDGTNCQTPKFTITTTNVSAGTEFKFYMSASGTFYVDCGAGGTLSGTGVTNNTITRNDTNEALYTCTYSTAGAKNIRMAGLATGYSTTASESLVVSTIRFGPGDSTPTLVASIDGSLGQIFPSFGWNQGQAPRFAYTFHGCTGLTSIPANLFSGITHNAPFMFWDTFTNCTSLASIPENLFWGISGIAHHLFWGTFTYCTSLTTIPAQLFKTISGSATDVFVKTFANCSGITSIPSILFSGIRGGANYMFFNTFTGCSSLTSIPDDLFSGITTSSTSIFAYTFANCTNLSGFIPPSTFSGLIANDSPTAASMWYGTFANTQILTACPSGMTQYITGYEDYWSGHISCVNANLTCSAGNYLPAHGYECAQCTANNYCVGGTYPYSATESHGITPCDTGYSSAAGASSCTPNTINIQWDDGNGGYTAGTCTYGGSITTPTTAPTKRGHVFTGWTFDLGSGS